MSVNNGDIGTEEGQDYTFLASPSEKKHPRGFKCLHRWITVKKMHEKTAVMLLQTCRRCGCFRQCNFWLAEDRNRLCFEGKTEYLKIQEDYRVINTPGLTGGVVFP